MSSYSAPSKQRAAQKASQLSVKMPLFLDTETTGIKLPAEIIEICIVDLNRNILIDSLVRPQGMIPADVTRIHGITYSMVRDSPTWPEIWPQIESVLQGRLVGIYNEEFDLKMLRSSHERNRMVWRGDLFDSFCVMKLYAEFYGQLGTSGNYRWIKLEDAARQCKIEQPIRHRARQDTLLAMDIFNYMVSFSV